MSRPANVECPAIKALHGLFASVFPVISVGTWRAGSGPRMAPDRHTAGLAIDIMLDSRDDDEKALADALIDAFIRHHGKMKWYDMVYVDWPDDNTPFYFHIPGNIIYTFPPNYGGDLLKKMRTGVDTGQAHRNHIHLDWCHYKMKAKDPADVYDWPPEASQIGFVGDLRGEFEAIKTLFAPQGTPGWLQGWWQILWRGESWYYFFDRMSKAAWSGARPSKEAVLYRNPLQNEEGRGVVAIGMPANGITIRWKSGSVEKYERIPGPKGDRLKGTWNDCEPVEAVRMS